jgi:hypothetical protein
MITKLDIHNINGRELFAEPGFALVAQTTQDGAALAREKEAQRIAKETAEQAQGHLFPSQAETALAGQFERTHETFRARMTRIAMVAGMPVLSVYALWRKYSEAQYDQSALVGEFVEWHAADLGGDKELLRKAAA